MGRLGGWESGIGKADRGLLGDARSRALPIPDSRLPAHSVATPEIEDSQALAPSKKSRTHARCLARSPAGHALASTPRAIALAAASRRGRNEAHAGLGGARDRPVRLADLRNDRAGLRSGCAWRCLARRDLAVLAHRCAAARSALAAAATLVAAVRRTPPDGVGTRCAGRAAGSFVAPARSPPTRSGEPGQQAVPSIERDRSAHRRVIQRRRIVRHALSPFLA